MKELNDSNFDTELANNKLMLVDFGSSWCGPCHRQEPICKSFSEKHDNIKVFKVDIDSSPDITARYSIRSLPTLIFFKDGKTINTLVGLTQLSRLEEVLNSL
jgi:thioredoxin 1